MVEPPRMANQRTSKAYSAFDHAIQVLSRTHEVINDYPLTCIDRSSSKVLWTNRVLGAYWGCLGGFAEQWVTVTESHDCVVVFGCTIGINIEGFRSDNGKAVFRFSTACSESSTRPEQNADAPKSGKIPRK